MRDSLNGTDFVNRKRKTNKKKLKNGKKIDS